jgi:hypothetical protein
MAKYDPITSHLASLSTVEWSTSFAELEQLMDAPLPPSARTSTAWWANTTTSQGKSWTSIGWKTTKLNLADETVTFIVGVLRARTSGWVAGLTMDQAKMGIATRLGVQPSQVHIDVRC